jgi:hypothetical protein
MKLALLLLPFAALAQDPPGLPAKASLEGQVVNAVGGEPLRKATLTLRINVAATPRPSQPGAAVQAQFIATTTDAEGKFLFKEVDPGDYTLTVRRAGFGQKVIGAMSDVGKREPVNLGPGDRKSGLTIKLTPYGVISGRVVDEEGDPIQAIPVSLMRWEYTSRGRELIEARQGSTDDRGEYRIYDISPGKYLLKFAHRGLRINRADESDHYAAAYFPGVEAPAGAAPFDIKAGQQLSGIGITLRRARLATIRGRVIAPPGLQVNVGLMVVSDQGSSSSSRNVDDKDYKFELGGLSPGPVIVIANYSYNGQRFNAQMPVDVGSSDINGIELRPSLPLEFTGTVRIEGKTEAKLSGMEIMLATPGRGASASVKEDGGFAFRNVEPNTYRVNVNRNGPALYMKSARWGSADVTDSPLDLTSGVPDRTELTIVLGADGAEIGGKVMNDKEPAEGARVTLIPTTRRSPQFFRNATAGSDGAFHFFAIAPGTYRLIAWNKVNVNAVMYDPDFLRGYDTAGETITVDAGQKKDVELKVTANQSPEQ